MEEHLITKRHTLLWEIIGKDKICKMGPLIRYIPLKCSQSQTLLLQYCWDAISARFCRIRVDLVHSMPEDFPNCSMETIGLVLCHRNISLIYWSICLIYLSQISCSVIWREFIRGSDYCEISFCFSLRIILDIKWIETELQVNYWLQELLSNNVIELIYVWMLTVDRSGIYACLITRTQNRTAL